MARTVAGYLWYTQKHASMLPVSSLALNCWKSYLCSSKDDALYSMRVQGIMPAPVANRSHVRSGGVPNAANPNKYQLLLNSGGSTTVWNTIRIHCNIFRTDLTSLQMINSKLNDFGEAPDTKKTNGFIDIELAQTGRLSLTDSGGCRLVAIVLVSVCVDC